MGELTDIILHRLEETTPKERAEEWNKLKVEIVQHPPKCILRLGDETCFYVYKDFNWFQQKMLKWCFGLTYKKL